jgi:HK97 family phage major capsid protein
MPAPTLYDQRAQATSEARQLLARADAEGRELRPDEEAHYQRIDKEIDRLNDEIAKSERLKAAIDARPRTDPAAPARPRNYVFPAGRGIPQLLHARPERRITLQRGSPELLRDQPRYRDAFRSYLLHGDKSRESLAMQASKANQGGYLTTTEFATQLILDVDNLVFMRDLANVLPPLSQAVSIGVPSRDARLAAGDWTPEIPATDISEDDAIRIGRRELTPHGDSKYVKVSNKLLRSGVIDVEAFVRNELAYCFATTFENQYQNGDGVSKPLGVFTASSDGVPTSRDVTCASATVFTADEIIDLLFNLKSQYQRNATGLFSREAVKRIRKLKDSQNQYLWQPGLGGVPNTILDRPYVQSEYTPNTFTTGLYVGMFADFKAGYWIADTTQTAVSVLTEIHALRLQTGFLGYFETDGQPVLAEAFSRLKLA